MIPLTDLWMPILLSAVFVFVVSSVIHMVIPIHKNDMSLLPNEDKVMESLRSLGVGPGDYMFPRACSMKDMGTPEMVEKMRKGPIGTMTILPPGPIAMGKCLVQWFLYSILVGAIAGYVGTLALPAGTDYATVFRVTGTAAILGYAVGNFPNSIWKGVKWGTTFKFVFDGVLYGLVTGGTFGWLWPKLM